MITTLVKENSNRVLLKDSEFAGFSQVFMFEEYMNYLICNKCHNCIKQHEKMINYIDQHKSTCEAYPKKSSTLDVHKLCFSCGIEKIMPWSKLNPKNKVESQNGNNINIKSAQF